MSPPLNIKKSRFLNLVLRIRLTIYIRYKQLSDCQYICNGRKNFDETWIYFKRFGIIVMDNKYIKIMENISLKYLSI